MISSHLVFRGRVKLVVVSYSSISKHEKECKYFNIADIKKKLYVKPNEPSFESKEIFISTVRKK